MKLTDRTAITVFLLLGTPIAMASERVTVENFARAETDTYFRGQMKAFGATVGQLKHIRQTVTPENQSVIRQNQDTLYSGVVLDLSKPVKITIPDTGRRYISMHVINQDHYMFVKTEPGTHELTKENVGTSFAIANFRIFVNPQDPDDVKKAHAAQDGIKVEGGGKGPFEAPDWDQESLRIARQALSDLAELGFSTRYAYGTEEETKPVDFLVGVAAGWGGSLPPPPCTRSKASLAMTERRPTP